MQCPVCDSRKVVVANGRVVRCGNCGWVLTKVKRTK